MKKNEKPPKYNVLIIDDNIEYCQALERALIDKYSILIASTKEEATKHLWEADLVLVDLRLDDKDANNKEGLEILTEFKSERPQLPIIMISAYGDISIAVEAMKSGAIDFLTKPVHLANLRATIDNALNQVRLQGKIKNLERELRAIEPIEFIGENERIKYIKQIIELVARDGYINVMIKGETGTGKELVARLIHQKGWRSEGPFVALSLASLAPSIIERELFGHEKGAFTDARMSNPGYIEQAHRGVLFLDDIDAAPLEIQAKLLRFLEERVIYRLGSTRPIQVDVQVIVATNQSLSRLVEEKKFREDLFYRINSIEIDLPPLREHAEDIPKLCHHFIKLYQRQGRTNVRSIRKEAMLALEKYSWPGNVRELRNVIERACIIANVKGKDEINLEDLPAEIQEQKDLVNRFPIEKKQKGGPEIIDIEREKARLELSRIEEALQKCGGKKTEAWKLLGLNDRFALRRRVLSIKKRYPDLFDKFNQIRSKFGDNKNEINLNNS